jgi:hypothetical protein
MKPYFLLLLFFTLKSAAQNIVNKSSVLVQPGTTLTVNGNWINHSGGSFVVNGELRVSGNLENHDAGFGFGGSTGKIILNGKVQTIGGTKPIRFPILELASGTKTLEQPITVGYGLSGNGFRLLLNSAFLKLNTKTLTVQPSSPSAIQRTTGFIESETNSSKGIGKIRWDITNAPQNTSYVFPFGNSSTNTYLPLTVTLQQAAPAGAFLTAATYATDAALQPNNRPLPATVLHFNDASNQEMAQNALDRFWIVGGENTSSGATVNLSATYRDNEWDGTSGSKNQIVENNLKPIFWNGNVWNGATGSTNTATNILSVSNLLLSMGIVSAKDGSATQPAITKSLKVNLYGGANPYNNPEWNNWNVVNSLNSGALKYNDASSAPITAALSQSNGIFDNGSAYGGTMTPPEVLRYTSSSSITRTLTFSGLSSSKSYNLELFASRSNTGNSTTFIADGNSITVVTDHNKVNKASFANLVPGADGKLVVTIKKTNTYNYLNGFILTESGAAQLTMAKRNVLQVNELTETELKVIAYPNPSNRYFTIAVNSSKQTAWTIRIFDALGRFIEVRNNIPAVGVFTIGAQYTPGTYYAEVSQGKERKTLKLIKNSN